VLGKEEEHKKTKLALDSALGFIRSLVAERINLRFATELMFREDNSTEYSIRIEEVLNKIKELDQSRPSSKGVTDLNKGKGGQGSGPKKNLRKHKEV
jgi:ribosome-binding factor A